MLSGEKKGVNYSGEQECQTQCTVGSTVYDSYNSAVLTDNTVLQR